MQINAHTLSKLFSYFNRMTIELSTIKTKHSEANGNTDDNAKWTDEDCRGFYSYYIFKLNWISLAFFFSGMLASMILNKI